MQLHANLYRSSAALQFCPSLNVTSLVGLTEHLKPGLLHLADLTDQLAEQADALNQQKKYVTMAHCLLCG